MPPMPLFPPPPLTLPPAAWPVMVLYAGTVLLEAEGEPEPGQLAVAWVIRTRVDRHPMIQRDPEAELLRAVILAPRQFSCWLEEYEPMRRARLTAVDPKRWEACWRAACGAWWRLEPDPTGGGDHYLNAALTRAGRPLHDLPRWYEERLVTARIGQHEFLRLG